MKNSVHGGGGCLVPGGGCLLLGVPGPGGGCLVPGGAWSQGVWCRGVPGAGGCVVQGGAWSRGYVPGRGGPGGDPPPGTATAAGGTHPTGMHCYS